MFEKELDIQDFAAIIRKIEIKNPEELMNRLKRYGFYYVDESVLLEAFGIAYGMNWLEEYYTHHEEEINNILREHHDRYECLDT